MKKFLLLLTFILSQGLIAAPIHDAAKRGDLDEVNRILRSTDVNAVDEEGLTPLHIAARHGYIEIAKFLIEAGADVNAVNRYGETPLHMAVYRSIAEAIVEILLRRGGDINVVNGAGANIVNEFEMTPLCCGPVEIAKLLIEADADVNAVNRHGQTPLHLAAKNHLAGTVEILLEDPLCDHTITDDNGRTPEKVAKVALAYLLGHHPEIVDMLHNAPSVEQKLVKSERNDVLQRLAARVANKNGVNEEDYNQIGPCLRHYIINIRKDKKPSSLTDQSVNEDEAGPSGYHSDDEELQQQNCSIQ